MDCFLKKRLSNCYRVYLIHRKRSPFPKGKALIGVSFAYYLKETSKFLLRFILFSHEKGFKIAFPLGTEGVQS